MSNGRRFAGRSVVGKVSIVAAFTLALQSLSVAAIAAPPTSTAPGNTSKTAVATTSGAASGLVKQGKAALAAGNYDKAIELLSKATLALGMTPASCDAHFNLGKAYCEKAKKVKLAKSPDAQKNFLASRKELRTAVRLGRGSVISVQANQYLLTNIPAHLSAPRTGEGTELIAARFGLHGQSRGIGGVARAQVFEFFAPWCQPCTKLKPVLAKIQKDYGDQIEIKSFNVDDDSAQDIIDQYEVSPIPTVIFLTPDSKVVGYSVGFAGEKSVNQQLAKILANNPAPATAGVAAGTKTGAAIPATAGIAAGTKAGAAVPATAGTAAGTKAGAAVPATAGTAAGTKTGAAVPATAGASTGVKTGAVAVPATGAAVGAATGVAAGTAGNAIGAASVKTPVSTDASVPSSTEAATTDVTTQPSADATTPVVIPKKPITVIPPSPKTSSTPTVKPASVSTTTVTTTTKKTATSAPATEATSKTSVNVSPTVKNEVRASTNVAPVVKSTVRTSANSAPASEVTGKTSTNVAPAVRKTVRTTATAASATEATGKTSANVAPAVKTSVRTSTTISKKPTTIETTTTRTVNTSSSVRKISRVVPSTNTQQVHTAFEKTGGSKTYENASKTTRSLASTPVTKQTQDAATTGHSPTAKKVIVPGHIDGSR